MIRIFEHLKTDWFRYGFETLAVIVGILSAFAIDNWDEKRKEIKREKLYQENIRAEFVSNKSIAESNLEFSRIQRSNSEMLINIALKDSVPTDTLRFLTALEHTGWTYSGSKYTRDEWSDLHSTGNMKIIRNQKLLQLLRQFYKRADAMQDFVPQFEGYNYAYRKIYGEFMDPELRLEISGNIGPFRPLEKIGITPDIERIVTTLRQNKRVSNSLVEVYMNQRVVSRFYEKHLTSIEEILEILE